jgi:hypothetical protein
MPLRSERERLRVADRESMVIAERSRCDDRAPLGELRTECRRIANGRNCEDGLVAQCIDGRSPGSIRGAQFRRIQVNHGARHTRHIADRVYDHVRSIERHRFPRHDRE